MVSNKAFSLGRRWQKSLIFDGCGVKKLATQGILTYCTTRTLPYHLYADGFELLVFGASLTSGSLSKSFLTDCKTAPGNRCGFSYRIRQISPEAPSLITLVRVPRNLARTSSGVRTSLEVRPSWIRAYTDFPKMLLCQSLSGSSPFK